MSKLLRFTFLVHMLVAILFGMLLLIIPGRFLGWFGWAPVDPLLSRVLGAASLALAWSSFRGWRATEWKQVAILVELEAVFSVLAGLGLLRHLLVANYPLMVWIAFGMFAVLAIAWIVSLVKK